MVGFVSGEERRFIDGLRTHVELRPPSQELFEAALPAAHAEVLHRLALALIREGVVPFKESGRSGTSRQLRGDLGEESLVLELSGEGPFLRYPRLEACYVTSGANTRRIRHPLELFDLITNCLGAYDPERIAAFRNEIDNGVANLALSLGAGRRDQARNAAMGISDLTSWMQGFASNDELRRALEREVRTGHRLHVCSKTRLGMSPRDVVRYAPELCPGPIDVQWVALHRRALHTSGSSAPALLRELWPDTHLQITQELTLRGLSPESYVYLPVHPWQAQNKLRQVVLPKLAEDDLIFASATTVAHPQLSLRTLEPHLGHGRITPYHLKLPIGVQTTSAERTVSPQSVCNGPQIAVALMKIVADDQLPLHVIQEVAGMGLHPHYREMGADVARHLSVLIRQNPSALASSMHENWLSSALCSKPSFGDGSLLSQWVRSSFRAQAGQTMLHDWVQRFWRRMCETLLHPVLVLMARYGIALEAHSQNCLIDFDQEGLPARLCIRDFGGVRIHRPALEARGFSLSFFEDSATEAASWQAVVSKVLHTSFQMHLVDVLQALRADGLEVDAPWAVALEVVKEIYRTQGLDAEWRRDEPLLLCRTIAAKCLFKMRLLGDDGDDICNPVPNALYLT